MDTRNSGLRLTVVVIVAIGKHLLELLLLRVSHQSFNLALAVLHDGLRLCVTILRGQRCVRTKALHLLTAISENGLKLSHLIAAQAELLAKMSGLFPRGRTCGAGGPVALARFAAHLQRVPG